MGHACSPCSHWLPSKAGVVPPRLRRRLTRRARQALKGQARLPRPVPASTALLPSLRPVGRQPTRLGFVPSATWARIARARLAITGARLVSISPCPPQQQWSTGRQQPSVPRPQQQWSTGWRQQRQQLVLRRGASELVLDCGDARTLPGTCRMNRMTRPAQRGERTPRWWQPPARRSLAGLPVPPARTRRARRAPRG